jgi:argininosuccinate lyase
VAELARGKSGRLLGNLMSLLTVIKGLPMTYNRDLQEDKEPLFDSIDTVELVLAVYADMIEGMEVCEGTMRKAASDPMLLATDLADHLVRQGVPFRQAHEFVGRLVAESIASKTPLDRLPQEVFDLISPAFGEQVREVFDLETALKARTNAGSPGFDVVARELARWQRQLRME